MNPDLVDLNFVALIALFAAWRFLAYVALVWRTSKNSGSGM